jgi:hypothetical protein
VSRAVALALLLSLGCATATVRDGERTYTARAFGASHAAAGKCDRVASDVTESTKDTERRETKDDERGTLCATANGGHGGPGMWATIAAGFSALLLLFGAGL